MRTLKLTLAYDGTHYVGWQRQINGPSIQQQLEEAFAPLCGGVPTIVGSGRTDAGVHALGQVASLRVHFDVPVVNVRRALNIRLPADIRVLDVQDVADDFHAQFSATGKSYRYRMATTEVLAPFDRWCVWHAPEPRDVDAMRQAADALVGRHDFATFQGRDSEVGETVRTLTRVDVTDTGRELVIDVDGDGFLRHMVRIMVGTLADIGAGLYPPDAVPRILAARDRRAAGRTAPAAGLTLVSVHYGPLC